MSTVEARSPPNVDISQSSPVQRNHKSANLGWNPISLRLYKVLGANYDDAGTREALDTLSTFYTTPALASPTSKEADGGEDIISEADENGSEITARWQKVVSLPRDTAAKARKSLRRDTEERLAEGSQKFLRAFGEVDEVSLAT
jgi:conserved oligomeric Golgi complex subunit 6